MNETARAIAERCAGLIDGLLREGERAEAERRFYAVAIEELSRRPPKQTYLPMYGGKP